MSATILDGNKIASEIRAEVASEVKGLTAAGMRPGLAVILVGNHPASEIYVRGKVKSCEEVGIYSEKHTPPDSISTDELPQYNVVYAGQQKVDELHCYIFDVSPKTIEKGERYFQGRIWIDDQDFQIVKNTGKSVPDIRIVKKKKEEENLFPQFTTWRQQIDQKYWFPTFSSADDVLHFHAGDVRIRQVLKFTDYKRAGTQD